MFTCEECGWSFGDVRLVEHGTDDVALCKRCFHSLSDDAVMALVCEECGLSFGDVRFVEHGTDDVALCKRDFLAIGEPDEPPADEQTTA